MNRRCAVAALAAAPLFALRPAIGRAAERIPRVGLMLNTIAVADLGNPDKAGPAPRIIEEGLRARGWTPGRNIELAWKSVEGRFERWPEVVDQFIRMPVDVLVVFSDNAALAAMQRTKTLPIVMMTTGVAMRDGIVASLNRPGRNVTGISFEQPPELNGKRLALLKQAAPRVTRLAFLFDQPPERVGLPTIGPITQATAHQLGMSLLGVGFKSLEEVQPAFDEALRQGANAAAVPYGIRIYMAEFQERMHELAIRHRIPLMHFVPRYVESGGLMGYGFDDLESYRRVPYYVDRILRGAAPSDLPIEQPTKFELAINLKTARAIGLTLPRSLVAQADRVID